MIPVYGYTPQTRAFFDTIPSGRSTVSSSSNNYGRKKRYRDAYDAASKFKEQTDYKAEKEASIKDNKGRDKATMKIAPDISVMEGYQAQGFTLPGQKGRSFGGLIGTVGGAIVGSAIPGVGPMMGSNIGGRVGSYF